MPAVTTSMHFYNAEAFANPWPVATIGQTDFSPLGGTRSQVTGPPLRQLDMGLARQFRVWGQRQFEIRVEAFNLTNTPSFNLPGSLNFLDARNFASITSMRNTPRQIQLGVKTLLVEHPGKGRQAADSSASCRPLVSIP